jgi:hypothetical protein
MNLNNIDLAMHIGYLLQMVGFHQTKFVKGLAEVGRELINDKQPALKLNFAKRKLDRQIEAIDEQVDRMLRLKEELKTISKNIEIPCQ